MNKTWVLLSALVAAMPAFSEEAEEKGPWSGETELGFTYESGNTNEENLLFKQKVIFESGNWLNTFNASAENSVSKVKTDKDDGTGTGNLITVQEDQRTAEKYLVSEKLDYFFSKHTYGFGRVLWEKDRFSGFDHQTSQIVGIGHSFYPDNESLTVKVEIGAGSRQDEWDDNITIDDPANPGNLIPDPEAGRTISEPVAYFSDEVVWAFSEGAELGQMFSTEYGSKNVVSRFEVYTKAQLVASLSMKISYEVKNTDVVPEGKENTDKKLNVSLLYSF